MSHLSIYDENGSLLEETRDREAMSRSLGAVGIRFESWRTAQALGRDANEAEVLACYRDRIDELMETEGFQSVDVVTLRPDHPDRDALRRKFLDEHTHADFEVRFFADGTGLFYIHRGPRVYGVVCGPGDFISVPADTPHWFDMGPAPDFKCIRLFTSPDGWVAHFTGNPIATDFPRFGE